jgi:hypothetical protein
MPNSDCQGAVVQADASHSPDGARSVAIRCLPRVPVAIPDIERWLERELDEFRHHNGRATLRLSRLTQALPSREIGIGWLIELELPRDQPIPAWDQIASMLRDLRLLGLQPTVLVPPTGRYGASTASS